MQGCLVQRGLDEKLKGSAYAIIEGADVRARYLRFSDLELTGDAQLGAISLVQVKARGWQTPTPPLRS